MESPYLRALRALLRLAGQDAVPFPLSAGGQRVLRRMATLATPPATIVDVGASDGRWSVDALTVFPGARALCVEAQDAHQPALRATAAQHPGISIEARAASDHDGEIHFRALTPLAGRASEQAYETGDTIVPCLTIDTMVRRHRLPGPYFVKLDTHGHEDAILRGASATLANASLVQIEAYNFERIGFTFWHLCEHMQTLGFRPAALAEPMVRPLDGLLWQMDLFFLPASHPSFTDRRYAAP